MRVSADFRGRGKSRAAYRNTTKRAKRKARIKRHKVTYGPSHLTSQGCSFVGSKRPLVSPRGAPSASSVAPGSLAALPVLASPPASVASAGCSLRGSPCGPPVLKTRRLDPQSCSLRGPSREQNSHAISPMSQGPGIPVGPIGARGPIEELNQEGRRPKAPPPTCVRGSGLCPLAGWAISEYCPTCHG